MYNKRDFEDMMNEKNESDGVDSVLKNIKTNNSVEKMVAISELHAFKEHPFKVEDNADMQKLIESIKESGIITPLIVRKNSTGNGYEIIAGHRRKYAAEVAGLTEIPVYVVDFDNDKATIAMVDSNLQRSKFLPSEKAFAYRMKMEALKHQGKRTDLDEAERGKPRMETVEKVAKDANDSASQVRRYIRLTYLNKNLLDMVDAGMIKLTPAVELSYLTQENQQRLYEYMKHFNIRSLSNVQAAELRKNGARETLNEEEIDFLLDADIANPKKHKIAFDDGEFKRYFKPDTSVKKNA